MGGASLAVCSYWDEMAHIYWLTGAPLRPSEEDVSLLRRLIALHAPQAEGNLRALMLGVTPGIATMEWPAGTSLVAADRSYAMVRRVWQGDLPGVRCVICADWRSLPLPDRSCHVVTGDGAANCVPYPGGLRELAAEAARVLRPEGRLLLRCYAQPEKKEEPGEVLTELRRGAIATFHDFKFRLLMALQEDVRRGIAVADVYRYWTGSGIDPDRLAAARGWDPEVVRAVDAYRDSPTVHVFPTLAQTRAVLGECFEEIECAHAAYPLARRCPVLVLKPVGH